MESLKLCPFCGSKAYQYEQNYYNRYVVECENCGVKTTNATIDSAIKDWNNRPVEESLQNTIESMKSCLNCEYNDVDTFFGDSCFHDGAKPDRDKFKRDCLAQNKKYWQLIKE